MLTGCNDAFSRKQSRPRAGENCSKSGYKLEIVDQLHRAIKSDFHLRALASSTTELVREACRRHELSGAAAIVLGRTLTAACLLTSLTKDERERVRIDIRGNGPLGRVLADCRSNGDVRGCLLCEPDDRHRTPPAHAQGARVSIAAYTGQGQLAITRDLGLERPYQGSVALTSGEIDEDLEGYLTTSEQLPSALGVEVLVDGHGQVVRAGGILCQTFPDGDQTLLERLRHDLRAGNLYDLLLRERPTADLLGFALGGADFDDMGTTPLQFACPCGPQTARAVVSTLGADDIEKLAGEREYAEVNCQFCGSNYQLTSAQLRELAAELRRSRS